MRKLKLSGFNNLTKTLSFNIYDICYANTAAEQKKYIEYINEVYSADRLTEILKEVVNIIGAKILNIAHQDYDPLGASVTVLICEEPEGVAKFYENGEQADDKIPIEQPMPETVLAHLDKSHVTVHTYPESHPDQGISTFRVDIDVSTCGTTSPLNALDYLIHNFESDIITLDYRVRGFTRDVRGKKHYIDHKINSIQNYLTRDILKRYQMIDVNVYQENIFHTKMILKEFDLDNYLFGIDAKDLSNAEQTKIRRQLYREMKEIFYGRNLTRQEIGEP
jgi:S-adenosylmethionine decarboxylase